MLPENVPPVYVPETLSATAAPSAPALPGTESVKVCVPPAAIVPPACGNGDPVAEPSVAEVRVTLVAGAPPVFVTLTVKVYPAACVPDTEEVVASDTDGAARTVIGTVAVAIVYVLYTVLLVTVALVVPASVAIAVGVKVTDRL
jgi:hypothetical protein